MMRAHELEELGILAAQAEQAAVARRWPQAIAAYERMLELRPGDPATLVQLSYVHSLAGHYRSARKFALEAYRTGTIDPKVLAELLPRLRTFNEGAALLTAVERAMPMSRMPIPLLLVVAAQLSYLNLPDRAIAFIDEAKRADPDYPPTLIARTQVLTYLGRFAEARREIERVLELAPEIAHAYWLRAALPSGDGECDRVEEIGRQLNMRSRTADEIALLAFALHRQLDGMERYAEAGRALELACRAKRSTLRYRAEETRDLFEALERSVDGGVAPDASSTDRHVPIFIVGMHRSGTTLLEQLLAKHGSVQGLGELYDFTGAMRYATDHHCRGVIDIEIVRRSSRIDFDEVGKRYLAGLEWRLDGRRYFTDKLPSNFLNIGFICRALPHAKILHMVRDPLETCFSNLRELFSDANPYSYDQIELADFYAGYSKLMRVWHDRFPGRILDVDYARLTASTEEELRRVALYCGFPFEAGMLKAGGNDRGVVTASAVQVRGGVYVRRTAKWVPYAEYLQPLIRRLGLSEYRPAG